MPKKKVTPWDKWSFNAAWIVSLILALGLSFGQPWASYGVWSIILVILGIVTGFIYKAKDITPLVLTVVALAVLTGSSIIQLPAIQPFLTRLVEYFLSYLAPATLIVGLRMVYKMFN
jgi:hypothetical protein